MAERIKNTDEFLAIFQTASDCIARKGRGLRVELIDATPEGTQVYTLLHFVGSGALKQESYLLNTTESQEVVAWVRTGQNPGQVFRVEAEEAVRINRAAELLLRDYAIPQKESSQEGEGVENQESHQES